MPLSSRILAVAVFATTLAGQPALAQDRPHAETTSSLDSLVRAFADGEAPGLSIFVLRGRDTLLLRGYGYANLEHSVPATPRTVYRIASVTKQFTAVAVMQLVEEGLMSLEDTIQRFLPSYPTQGHQVTIRHLLAHTSGIRDLKSIEWKHDPAVAVPAESVIATIAREPFDFAPGEDFRYNNSGYYLLGIILEKVTGQPCDQVVKTRIAAPLGLADTRYCFAKPIIPRRAAGYEIDYQSGDGVPVNAAHFAIENVFAAGGLCSTVLDLVTWTRALFAGEVVQPATLDAMVTSGVPIPGSANQSGFGFVITEFEGHRRVWHGGNITGFRAILEHYPDDDLTIAVLTNYHGGGLVDLISAITRVALGLRE